MHRFPLLPPLCALMIIGAAIACSSSSDETAPKDVVFSAQAAALPGFSYDTGLQPPSGPAQMSLTLAAEGNVAVEDGATATSGGVTPKASTGSLKLDVHVRLKGTLKVNVSAVKYDGPLPGLSAVDIPITGQTAFDGFLLDGATADVSASIPETKLPDVPFGTVPGHLSITVAAASKLTTSFKGACVAVQGGKATYAGVAITTGSLVLKSQLVLDIPLVKPIDLPAVTVPIPGIKANLLSAPVDVGTSDTTIGTCGPALADGGAEPGQDGATGTDGGTDGAAQPDGNGLPGDLVCANESTYASCSNCCEGKHTGGRASYETKEVACLCLPTRCGAQCGDNLCDGGAASAACSTCSGTASGSYCADEKNIGCAVGDSCTGYAQCSFNTACNGKP